MKKELSRQRKWQLQKKSEGLCVICGKKRTIRSANYCEKHRAMAIVNTKEWQKRHPRV